MQKIQRQELALICRLDREWDAETIKVERLGGQTNRNFVVTHRGKKFFVRLPWESTGIINRQLEGSNMVELVRTKQLEHILPRYLLYIVKKRNTLTQKSKAVFDVPDGTMVAEYIEGQELNGKLLGKKEVQKALVQSLYIFHTSGVRFQNSYDVFRDEIEKYRLVAKKYPLEKVIMQEALRKMEFLEESIAKKFVDSAGVSTHNDLEFENLLLGSDGQIYLLDFEYAGFNVRGGIYYDFGTLLGDNISHEHPLTLEVFDEILLLAKQTYGQELDRQQILYGAFADFLVMFWWALAKYFTAETQEEKEYLIGHAMQGVRGVEQLSPQLRI